MTATPIREHFGNVSENKRYVNNMNHHKIESQLVICFRIYDKEIIKEAITEN